MRPQTEQTIRAAWARLLGLDDLGNGERVLRVNESAETVSFVRVCGRSLLSGPSWALDRARNLRDDQLAQLSVLLRLTSDHGGRALGSAELSFIDTRVEHVDLPTTQDEAAVTALEEACSAADVDEVGLSGMPHRWVLLERPESAVAKSGATGGGGAVVNAEGEADAAAPAPVPLAGSAYVVWAEQLAHMGVLTSPAARGRGYGILAAAVGTNAALDAGLIPQWRSRWDNEPSKRIAQVLGYEPAGSQTTVFIDPEA